VKEIPATAIRAAVKIVCSLADVAVLIARVAAEERVGRGQSAMYKHAGWVTLSWVAPREQEAAGVWWASNGARLYA
jgi:hypothetical protein